MFDFELSKIVLFGVVALVVVGPKELPAALRVAGQVMTKLRRVRSEIQNAANSLMADAAIDREIATLNDAMRVNLALDPATAMRGNLPGAARAPTETEAMEYASPEMQAYLAPLDEAPLAEGEKAPLAS